MDKIKTFESFSESEKTFTFSELPKEIQEKIIDDEIQAFMSTGKLHMWSDITYKLYYKEFKKVFKKFYE